jgi:hypothetical protein
VDGDGSGGRAIDGPADLVYALVHRRRKDDHQECPEESDTAENSSRDGESATALAQRYHAGDAAINDPRPKIHTMPAIRETTASAFNLGSAGAAGSRRLAVAAAMVGSGAMDLGLRSPGPKFLWLNLHQPAKERIRMIKRRVSPVLAAIGVGGLAFANQLPPAAAQESLSVELGDLATLQARGAAVSVSIEVTCPVGYTRSVPVRVTQRVGSRIARGAGGTSRAACTGDTQTVDVWVHAEGQAFKKGPAVAEASLVFCNDFSCQFVSDTENIQIVRLPGAG